MLCAGSESCHLAFSTPGGARNASHEQNNLAEAKGNSRFNQLSGKNELLFFFSSQWAILVVCKHPSKGPHGGISLELIHKNKSLPNLRLHKQQGSWITAHYDTLRQDSVCQFLSSWQLLPPSNYSLESSRMTFITSCAHNTHSSVVSPECSPW